MASSTLSPTKHQGGSFLLASSTPEEIFSPEDFTEEHRAIARTTEEFWNKEVAPNVDAIQHQDTGLTISILRKSGELGLTGVILPEKFGGMEMDLTSAMIVAEGVSRDGSYSAWHGAHTGIGTLPLLLFGTEEQKQRYLPKLASAETVAAYALSEPQAGSDALAAKTRADLSPDGTHYVLNGQKMWITNGGKADLYTVFAKIGGEQFTAFLVERGFHGLSNGAEEKKMGIKGSSTTPVFFDNVPVPVENVLGEIGRGHIIAFNILNLGRLKLGAFAIGAAKNVLQVSLAYAKDRKAFGTTISHFGMIQHKLAEMAIRTYAAESMTYRVEGLIQSRLEDFSWEEADAPRRMMKAVEEFAAECSVIKVFASEMLDYVVDEGVQIHGGYGYHQDYAVERAYRDSRINRIFEGTNEINRLLITGMLLKRAQQGRLALVQAATEVLQEVLGGPRGSDEELSGPFAEETRILLNAKKIALLLMGVAYQKYMMDLEKQQEVLAAITDVIMDIFAMESTLLRTQKLAESGKGANAADMTAVLVRDAMAHIDVTARIVLAACSEGDSLRTNLVVLRRFGKYEPVDSIALRRKIAHRLLDAERYIV